MSLFSGFIAGVAITMPVCAYISLHQQQEANRLQIHSLRTDVNIVKGDFGVFQNRQKITERRVAELEEKEKINNQCTVNKVVSRT